MDDFIGFWESNKDVIYRYLLLGTYQRADADDLLQDVAYNAYKAWPNVPNRNGNLSGWLYTIAKNSLYRYYKTQKRTVPVDLATIDNLISQHDYININEIAIKEFLRALPDEWRVILHMSLFQGYSTKEIAKITHSNKWTIYKRIKKGIELLASSVIDESERE